MRTPEQTSRIMSRIRGKDTGIELALRRELWSRGIRYRKHPKKVFGKPDIAFIGLKIAVFCDSEFWHGKDWEIGNSKIKTNRDFWIPKIERNIQRDAEVNEALESEGWLVLRFWGQEILKDVGGCADAVEEAIRLRKSSKP
ncbi:MAG: very short patch repair endonuclease [Thermoplasmatales archaeon]|nr:very short patch repair endonuclease [Thermoplasmatales archaeon]